MIHLGNRKIELFECEDVYEAEKLAGLVTSGVHQEDKSGTYVRSIDKVIENEVIITLKDKSSHSILMKDSNNAMRLKGLLFEIVKEKKRTILESSFESYTTKIITEE
jgi:uncharacterized beta-barrel protein YwiB (DUF1934 family)